MTNEEIKEIEQKLESMARSHAGNLKRFAKRVPEPMAERLISFANAHELAITTLPNKLAWERLTAE